MQQRMAKTLCALIYPAGLIGGLWLTFRFLFPWTAPFLLAFAVATILEKPVRTLVRRGWRRSLAAGFLTLAVLGLVGYLTVQLSAGLISAANSLAGEMPGLMAAITQTLEGWKQRAQVYVSQVPEELSAYLDTALRSVSQRFFELPGMVSQWALGFLASAAQSSPDVLLFLVTAGIGSYFISAAFPRVIAFLTAQIPEAMQRRWTGVGQNLKEGLGGLFRAQLMLMALTFFQLLLTFLLLQVKRAVTLAAVTALIDALPVFGTGIVLLPWAAYCLLLGQSRCGIGLLICWGCVNLVRNCAQAKLVGDQIGLDPIVSLFAVYMGWQVWGVGGMLLFPLIFVLAQQLNCRGVIHLWKSI